MFRITILVLFRTALCGCWKAIDWKEVWWERGWEGERSCILSCVLRGELCSNVEDGVKDFIGKDCLFIIKLVVSCGFLDVKAFYSAFKCGLFSDNKRFA